MYKIKKIKNFLFFMLALVLHAILISSLAEAKSPVITLVGQKFVSVEKGSTYADAGATAIDAEDGDLTDKIEVYNSVNTDVAGYYIVAYKVVDSDGNEEVESVGRLVAVIDKSLPIIFTDIIAPSIPIAKPAAGYYDNNQNVSLSSSDKETGLNKIYYTIDGTDPNKSSKVYSSAIKVDRDMIIKAIAYDKAGNKSAILTAKYQIDKDDNDEDDDDDDNDDDSESSPRIIYKTLTSNSDSNNENTTFSSDEKNENFGKVEGEQIDSEKNDIKRDNQKEVEEIKPEKNYFWWWVWIILLIGLVILAFILRKKEEKGK